MNYIVYRALTINHNPLTHKYYVRVTDSNLPGNKTVLQCASKKLSTVKTAIDRHWEKIA